MEKAIIIQAVTKDVTDVNYELNELESLLEACDCTCTKKVTQNLDKINPAFYFNKGKLAEIKEMIEDEEIIAVNDELTPSQIANLEEYFDLKIFDRTYIILEIFSRRAKTKEAIYQVELAKLRYLLPRLKSLHDGFSHQQGKGSGEKQIDIDRRHIGQRISLLKEEIAQIKNVRNTQRIKRTKTNTKTVSLVGYTNSGKSSILNCILQNFSDTYNKDKLVFEKNMLFATLDTYTREIKPNIDVLKNKSFLLTDTVGFVEKLPHHLVEAFKSTLEEIKESDLIVMVVDCTNPNYMRHIKTTNEVLESLDIKDIEILYVFNKIDLHEGYFYIPNSFPDAIRCSSKTKENIDKLLIEIDKRLFKDNFIKLLLPFSRGDIVNHIKSNYRLTNLEYTNEGIRVDCYVSDLYLNKVKEFEIK